MDNIEKEETMKENVERLLKKLRWYRRSLKYLLLPACYFGIIYSMTVIKNLYLDNNTMRLSLHLIILAAFIYNIISSKKLLKGLSGDIGRLKSWKRLWDKEVKQNEKKVINYE